MKAKVSQDFLYDYILKHNVNISTIAKFMDLTTSLVYESFRHSPDMHGHPRNFSANGIAQLNAAIAQLSEQMKQSVVTFGSDQTFTNRGGTFDPGTLPAIKALSRYFNLTAMLNRLLGWSETRKNGVFSSPTGKVYGRIRESDVSRINAELLAVSGMLGGIEVE